MHRPETGQENPELEEIRRTTVARLTEHAIPFENWGKGSAKTLDHLINEVAEGETVLEVAASGELVRKVSITYVDVWHTDPSGRRWKLVEEKQVFKDGRERRRTLDGSIAEKLKAAEVPDQHMVNRAIREELGIEGDVSAVANGSSEVTQDSPSYPGLTMKAVNHYFSAELDEAQYKPEGYVEHQADKDNYFVWKEERR